LFALGAHAIVGAFKNTRRRRQIGCSVELTGVAARTFRADAILGGASQPIPAPVVSNARTEGMDQKDGRPEA